MRLSVVVTIVDGGAALERCLEALRSQADPPDEVIVPWDDTVTGIGELTPLFPGVRFLALGAVATHRPAAGYAGQHELFDRRRAAGLAAATGELVAIVEDRGVPAPEWAATMRRLHRELPHQVIGGSVGLGRNGAWHWAVYLCDYGRYHPDAPAGAREYVTDINVCYKRAALDATRALWAERYHETTVQWALRREGATLWFDPSARVDQVRDDLSLGRLVGERVAWGRLFAATRARESTLPGRLLHAAASPLLPAVLLLRLARTQWAFPRTRGRMLAALPRAAVLLAAWSTGELMGYLTARD